MCMECLWDVLEDEGAFIKSDLEWGFHGRFGIGAARGLSFPRAEGKESPAACPFQRIGEKTRLTFQETLAAHHRIVRSFDAPRYPQSVS